MARLRRNRCTAHAVEAAVWADIEQIARNPGPALTGLAKKRSTEATHVEQHHTRLAELQQKLEAMQCQRDDILALYRRKLISERDLERQLADIKREEAGYADERDGHLAALQRDADGAKQLDSARVLLQQLHALLDEGPITPELKCKVAQTWVIRIDVKTVEAGLSQRAKPKYKARFSVTYVFGEDVLAQLRDTITSPARR
jgi:site-specific DNA recombinase